MCSIELCILRQSFCLFLIKNKSIDVWYHKRIHHRFNLTQQEYKLKNENKTKNFLCDGFIKD